MSKICKQVSIESPATFGGKEFVFSYDVMVPDVPLSGARVKVLHVVHFYWEGLFLIIILLPGYVRWCLL